MSESTPQPEGTGAPEPTPVPLPTPPLPVPSPPALPQLRNRDSELPRWVGYRNIRDLALGVLGAALMIYEVMFAPEINALIVSAAAGLLGAPVVLRTDEKSK